MDIKTDPGTDGEHYVRIGYACTSALILAWIGIVMHLVSKSKDATEVEVEIPAGVTEAMKETITYSEYDKREVNKFSGQQVFLLAFMGGLHLQFHFIKPLVLQIVLMPIALYKHQLTRVYLLGEEPAGELGRPWKAAVSPFTQAFISDNPGLGIDAVAKEKEGTSRSKQVGEKDVDPDKEKGEGDKKSK